MKEHKHFNMRRLLTVVLMLALVLSTAATGYAADLTESVCENPDPGKVIKTDWTNFRGNNTHNAVTKNPVPTKASEAALLWATKSGTGYGAQAVGSPILVDGYLYYNQGKTINKMDAISGERVASAPMVNNSSFSIVPPTYADGKIFVGLAGGIVQAFDAKTLKSLWVYTDKLGGQPNCPITYYDGYGTPKRATRILSASASRMKIRKRPTKRKKPNGHTLRRADFIGQALMSAKTSCWSAPMTATALTPNRRPICSASIRRPARCWIKRAG